MSLVDADEELDKVHIGCREEYFETRCPVCSKPVIKTQKFELPPELQDKVYRPGTDGDYFTPTYSNVEMEDLERRIRETM